MYPSYRCITHIGRSNEDRYCVATTNNLNIYCVFDGHGGPTTSSYLRDHLTNELGARLQSVDLDHEEQVQKVITQTFLDFDYQLLLKGVVDGSTATVAILTPNKIYIANLGDSRSVIYDNEGNILIETGDHKPGDPYERSRIEQTGGTVINLEVDRVNGTLAVSRAFGDLYLKRESRSNQYTPVGWVSVIPDLYVHSLDLLDRGNLHILMASDGLWDGIPSQTAVKFLLERQDAHIHLMNVARNLTTDDITILMIDL